MPRLSAVIDNMTVCKRRAFFKENFVEPTNVHASEMKDWHPADVLAALKKRGLTLAGLSVANGYHATAAGKALKNPWPALEKLIATALGLEPRAIWPNRYTDDGTPLAKRSGRAMASQRRENQDQ
jgi:Ner family transcriptional regulator